MSKDGRRVNSLTRRPLNGEKARRKHEKSNGPIADKKGHTWPHVPHTRKTRTRRRLTSPAHPADPRPAGSHWSAQASQEAEWAGPRCNPLRGLFLCAGLQGNHCVLLGAADDSGGGSSVAVTLGIGHFLVTSQQRPLFSLVFSPIKIADTFEASHQPPKKVIITGTGLKR